MSHIYIHTHTHTPHTHTHTTAEFFSQKSHGSGNLEKESIGNHWAILHPWDTHYQFRILKKSITLKELVLEEVEVQNVCTCVACVCVYLSESIYAWKVSFKRVFGRSCLTEVFCILQHTATHRGLTATHCNTGVSCWSLPPPQHNKIWL